MSSERRKPFAGGFTLVEALVVLLVIVALLLITIPALFRILQNYNLKTATTQLAIHLRLARNQCVTQKLKYRAIIRSKSAFSGKNTYQIEYAPAGDSTFVLLPHLDFRIPPGVEIQDSAIFTSGVATIDFNTRGGATSVTGTPPYDISLKSKNGLTYRIRIQLSGEVEVAQT